MGRRVLCYQPLGLCCCKQVVVGSEHYWWRQVVLCKGITQKERTGEVDRIVATEFLAARQGNCQRDECMIRLYQPVLVAAITLEIAQQIRVDQFGQDALPSLHRQSRRNFCQTNIR